MGFLCWERRRDMFGDIADLGSNISLVCQDKNCSIYQVRDRTGEGTMTCYSVFPGVVLNYNDFHQESCMSEFQPVTDMLCINHCREGRIEWEFQNNQFIYLESGDLQINNQHSHCNQFSFPLRHYHGLTVSVFPKKAQESINAFAADYNINLPQIIDRFMDYNMPFIMRAGPGIEHIFSELYNVPEKIRKSYHKIKVLELFLFLSTVEVTDNYQERPYFHRIQVDRIKEIKAFLEENIHHHFTLEELSKRFDMALTSMKLCFKAVYGNSIYSYMRIYRMNAAATLLRQGDSTVSEIAANMGYGNASKFSAAFKKVIGLTPSEYRKAVI